MGKYFVKTFTNLYFWPKNMRETLFLNIIYVTASPITTANIQHKIFKGKHQQYQR